MTFIKPNLSLYLNGFSDGSPSKALEEPIEEPEVLTNADSPDVSIETSVTLLNDIGSELFTAYLPNFQESESVTPYAIDKPKAYCSSICFENANGNVQSECEPALLTEELVETESQSQTEEDSCSDESSAGYARGRDYDEEVQQKIKEFNDCLQFPDPSDNEKFRQRFSPERTGESKRSLKTPESDPDFEFESPELQCFWEEYSALALKDAFRQKHSDYPYACTFEQFLSINGFMSAEKSGPGPDDEPSSDRGGNYWMPNK